MWSGAGDTGNSSSEIVPTNRTTQPSSNLRSYSTYIIQAIQDGSRAITLVVHVLMPRLPTQTLGLLHPRSSWLPASLAPRSLNLSLPFLQIEMPLSNPSNSLLQSTNTLPVTHTLNTVDTQPHRNDADISQPHTEGSSSELSQTSAGLESQNLPISYQASGAPQEASSDSTASDMKIISGFESLISEDIEVSNEHCEPENVAVRPYADSAEDLSLSPTLLSNFTIPTLQRTSDVARQLANKVIVHARYNKVADEHMMQCLDCGLIPTQPVTGQCGHTRCTKCIINNGTCPCGVAEPESLHVNTLIQGLITKMLAHRRQPCRSPKISSSVGSKGEPVASTTALFRVTRPTKRRRRFARSCSAYPARASSSFDGSNVLTIAMSMQARYECARELITLGRHQEAASHLAHVAASTEPMAKQAHALLAQTIMSLMQSNDSRRVTRDLYRGVRQHSAAAWLQASDLECVLCCNTFTEPVTTPCGHTYCRTCIERSLDYRKTCALCLRSLDNFNWAMTHDTYFVVAALASIDALNPPRSLEPDMIPIFVCTVAYPSIPCPLFVFDPRHWMMLRRILKSGSRKFGMVAYERNRSYSDYGTILKVCDCVHLEDGRSILSTIGISRFRVLERDVRDGCDAARIQHLPDVVPTNPRLIWDLRLIASQICCKALLWLNSMNKDAYADVEAAFGPMPDMECQGSWWESQDGPTWLWWLIAVIPLRPEIKVLILSTQSLLKRMLAVARTLEAIDQIDNTSTAEVELRQALNNAEQWMRRAT